MSKDKLAEMPRPENPYNYQDTFDSRVAFWEGAEAQRRLLAEDGWMKLPDTSTIGAIIAFQLGLQLGKLGGFCMLFENYPDNFNAIIDKVAEELHRQLMEEE